MTGRIQELELKVKQLERQERERERERHIVIPTSDEIAKYGGTPARIRDLFRKPELRLGILGILGPIAALIYQQHQTNEMLRKIDSQLSQIQQQISGADRRLADAHIG